MYKFEQQLDDRIELLLWTKENKEGVLSIYIDKKRSVQSLNRVNREIVDLNDKIKLLERIKYDYVDFQDKIGHYINNFCENEKFITDMMDVNIKGSAK